MLLNVPRRQRHAAQRDRVDLAPIASTTAAALSPSGRFIHTRERVVWIEPPQNGEPVARIERSEIRATLADRGRKDDCQLYREGVSAL